MLNHENFAVSIGRAVETMRAQPDAIREQKAQLRALVALSKLGGATLALDGEDLTVEGTPIPPAFPGIRTLIQQMDAHLVREVRIAQNASAADLLALVRALAVNSGGYDEDGGIEQRMRTQQATSVAILSAREDTLAAFGRPISVTEAFEIGPILEQAGEVAPTSAQPVGPAANLEEAVERLRGGVQGPDLLERASEAARLALDALSEDRTAEAINAMARLVELHEAMPDGGARRGLGVVLRRLLTEPILTRVALEARDPAHRAAAATVLLGAASGATVALLGGADRTLRMIVARVIDGRRGGPLAATLIAMAERDDDEEERDECCRALGRIGTPESLQALIQMVQPGGRIFKRKRPGPRLSAVEGLKVAGNAAAIGTLEGLVRDRNLDVRRAVEEALEDLQRR